MNKAEFVNRLGKDLNITTKDSGKYLEAFLDIIKQTLAEGGTVNFVGFGNFYVKDVAERKVRNPQTLQEMIVPKKRRPTFKAGTALKSAVNQ